MRVCAGSMLLVLMSGCESVGTPEYPNLNSYAGVAKGSYEYIAAWNDMNIASKYCRDIHNSYERRSKNAEKRKLALGAAGGVFGFTGAMLVAAGTGGAAGGIVSGLAGVSSIVLGNAEKGPLGTSAYTEEKVSIAQMIQRSSAEAAGLSTSDHVKLYALANSLRNSCFAALAIEQK